MPTRFLQLAIPDDENPSDFYYHWLRAKQTCVDPPPEPIEKPIDPNMTMGEVMQKGLAPPGMMATWSENARKKYEACVTPHIDTYKFQVDKINREAEKNYDLQNYGYYSTVVGSLGVGEIFAAAKGDAAFKARWSFKLSPKIGFGAARVSFWVAFTVSTIGYVYIRLKTMEFEAKDFIASTEFFIKKVNDCRQNNPYDMWRMKTLKEQQLDENIFMPSYVRHPNRWLFVPE